jgi:hypothetical protein
VTRARHQSQRDEALWQVHQLNAKTAEGRSEPQRRIAHALAAAVVALLGLVGLMIWAAWL